LQLPEAINLKIYQYTRSFKGQSTFLEILVTTELLKLLDISRVLIREWKVSYTNKQQIIFFLIKEGPKDGI